MYIRRHVSIVILYSQLSVLDLAPTYWSDQMYSRTFKICLCKINTNHCWGELHGWEFKFYFNEQQIETNPEQLNWCIFIQHVLPSDSQFSLFVQSSGFLCDLQRSWRAADAFRKTSSASTLFLLSYSRWCGWTRSRRCKESLTWKNSDPNSLLGLNWPTHFLFPVFLHCSGAFTDLNN